MTKKTDLEANTGNPAPSAGSLDSVPSVAIGDVGDLPEVTTGKDNPAVPAPAPAAPSPPSDGAPLLDLHGQAWSADLHETPPRMNKGHYWAKIPGRVPEVIKDKSFFRPPGRPAGVQSSAGRGLNGAAVPEGSPPPGLFGLNIQADAVPGLVTAEEYEATSTGIVSGLFGILRMTISKAWTPEGDEELTWRKAVNRVWTYYQLPRLGPLIELGVLGVGSAAKRSEDKPTKKLGRRILNGLRWCLGMKPLDDPEAVKPAPPAAPEGRA